MVFRRAASTPQAVPSCSSTEREPLARSSLFCEGSGPTAATARRKIAEIVGAFHPEQMVRDAQLVASELITNALEHGAIGTVVLDVAVHPDGVSVCVTSHGDGDRLPETSTWELPDAAARSGRGLAVTQALSDAVRVVTVRGAAPGRDLISVTARVV